MADYDFDAMNYNHYAVGRSIENRRLDPASFMYAATPQGLEWWATRETSHLDEETIAILCAMEELYSELRLAHKMAGYA